GEDNIGISALDVKKSGKDVNVQIEVYNNNQQTLKSELKVKIINTDNNTSQECVKNLDTLTKENFGCEFKNLANGNYAVQATLVPNMSSCQNCFNNELNDDKIITAFNMGASGLQQCEPFNTSRLLDFVNETLAQGKSLDFSRVGGSKESLKSLVEYDAYLLQDQYSKDMQKDFDEYARTKSFFGAPTDYLKAEGLGEIFKDTDFFKFESKLGDAEPTGLVVQPGRYSVDLEIGFKNKNWKFFENGKPAVEVKVKLQKKEIPTPDSPFYYMPLDGLLGEDNDRVNYGTNFEGDVVNLNNDPDLSVKTVNTPNSNALRKVVVQKSDNYMNLNILNRGIVFSLERAEGQLNLNFSPSYATPLMLKVSNSAQEAYAVYAVNIKDTLYSNLGPENFLWTGIGLNCKDFAGRTVTDAFDETSDKHLLDNAVVQCARGAPNKEIDYAVEWCGELVRQGDVFLKTIVFTPQETPSSVRIESFSDSASFSTGDESNKNEVQLSGVPAMKYNHIAQTKLQTLEEIFKLVRDKKLCMSATEGLKTEFVWNPKEIYKGIQTQEQIAKQACIAS
ncbi:MAG: hypothetical protein Q7K42_04675, partial [Candidatus Diapherotrites archaeon]|nr:hypothetical protein [Candidatus Diapherotrites archaeon]